MAETIPISQGIPPDRRTISNCDILAINVAWYDWRDAYRRVDEALAGDGQTVFAFLNANNANLALRNPDFRTALSHSVVLPDGFGIDIAAKALHGRPFPAPRATPKCTSENGSVMSVLPCGRARRWRESCKRRFAYASRLPSPDPR